MTIKQATLYQVREFVGNNYSKQLGRHLRNRKRALSIVRRLEKQGREVFCVPMKIYVRG